jgi:hypothetical protein
MRERYGMQSANMAELSSQLLDLPESQDRGNDNKEEYRAVGQAGQAYSHPI